MNVKKNGLRIFEFAKNFSTLHCFKTWRMSYEHGRITLYYEELAQAASQPFGIIKSLAFADLRNDLITKGLRHAEGGIGIIFVILRSKE